MAFGKVFSVLVVLSVAATGAALARDISSGKEGGKGNTVKTSSVDKADKDAKGGQGPASVRHAKPQAPIVMGRSVSDRHKTKLHHVKMKPLDSTDSTSSAAGSR